METRPPKLVETRSLGDVVAPAGEVSLLVVGQKRSQRVSLPASGALDVGRDPDADLVLDDHSVSRRHARLTLRDNSVSVADLGSHNGTRVNGQRVDRERQLELGDIVSLGGTSLVVSGAPRRPRREPGGQDALFGRIAAELRRAERAERELAVATFVDLVPEGQRTLQRYFSDRHIEAAPLEPGTLAVVLPELASDEARALLKAAAAESGDHASSARVGLAVHPRDGGDAAALLGAARRAARGAATAGSVPRVAPATYELAIGDRSIIVADPAMERLFDLVRRLAVAELPVLIAGETGAGKENLAYAVHALSPRAAAPFVAVNAAALPDALLESELFGYKKGAFTGAERDKPGLFEAADGGTLFLDEVAELTASAQAKLLRALDQGEITRVGETAPRSVSVRVVAATHRDLEAMVATGAFRRDLFYRLAAACVAVPPLRERRREVPLLAQRFLEQAANRDANATALSDDCLRALATYPWPGNVRELKNAIEFAAATCDRPLVQPWHLPPRVQQHEPTGDAPTAPTADEAVAPAFRPIAEELADLEKERMEQALAAANGVRAEAARLLSMPRRTFTLKMRKYDLS